MAAERELKDTFRRPDDFVSLYSNHVRFEVTPTDLKMIFGEIDQSGGEEGTPVVTQHTAITVSWIQAKVLEYFLRLNIAANDLAHGKVSIPPAAFPSPPAPPEGEVANNPEAVKIYEAFSKIYDEFKKSQ